jgi:A/G-specific adenine glycosylase
MDYGTHLKKNTLNPNQKSAHYAKQSAFKGSNRELRGKILKTLLGGTHTPASLTNMLGMPQGKINAALKQLERDGLIQATRRRIRVAQKPIRAGD